MQSNTIPELECKCKNPIQDGGCFRCGMVFCGVIFDNLPTGCMNPILKCEVCGGSFTR